ncbi:Peptidyl-prolyl cis-trans isomerase pin4 [Thecaphora frezii]
MTDQQLERTFNSLNIGDSQHDAHQPAHYMGSQRQAGSASLRSPTGLGSNDLPGQSSGFSQQSPPSTGQSASARFERFFPSSSSPVPTATQASNIPYGGTQMSANGNLSANSAFGGFGHNLGPGTIGSTGGSGNFGSATGMRKNSRAGIPSQWGSNTDPSLSPASGDSPPTSMASPASFYQSHAGGNFAQQAPVSLLGNAGNVEDDIIPTAIVVKNIPFSVKKEQLLQIIEDLSIPMPYAFNYHFDQGVFRGLAFANFRTGEEADAVVAALNGFDVSGRKLRVEYKKVLQAGEKERIEKEKAIKRMQSMQLEKERERERRRQEEFNANAYLMPGAAPGQGYMQHGYSGDMVNGQSQGFDNLSTPRAPLTADSLKAVPSAGNGPAVGAPSELSSNAAANPKKEELDLNDAATLEIYSRVLLFKDDRMRDELSFSRSLSPLERRTVHLVAQRLGLYHYSMGEGEERYVIVTKNEVPAQNRPLRTQASTIGRSHRGVGGEGYGSGLLAPGSSATMGRSALRMKKSAPDMKRGAALDRDVSANGAYSSGMLAPGSGSLAGRRSQMNLRDGYSATMGRRPQPGGIGGAAGLQSLFSSPFDVPPVPSLGSSGMGEASNGANGTSPGSNLLRQPRGPPTPGTSEARNFAHRSRVQVSGNGHSAHANGGSRVASPQASAFRINVDDSKTHGHSHMSMADVEATTHSPLEI